MAHPQISYFKRQFDYGIPERCIFGGKSA